MTLGRSLAIAAGIILACISGTAPAADAVDSDGIGQTLARNARELVSEIGQKAEAWRSEAQGFRQWQQVLVTRQDAQALANLENLARRGHPGAMNFVGWLLDHGRGGVPQNSYKAATYFREAARLGDTNATYNLGLMFLQGRGIKADPAAARLLFEQATAKSNPYAAIRLAMMAERDRRYDEAARFYSKGLYGGKHTLATFKTGFYAFRGTGGVRDRKGGIMLMDKAAGQWDPEAMATLMEIKTKGIFVPEDPVEAGKWFILLSRNPIPEARNRLETVRAMVSFTDTQWEGAQKAAAIWLKYHPLPDLQTIPRYNETIF